LAFDFWPRFVETTPPRGSYDPPEAIVDHRHLTPQEFDLLVDGEEGFGMAPLAAHIEECVTCRTELEARHKLVASLERLPHYTPSPLFAYHVMREVQVFEPWHVAAMNSVQRFIPRSRPARVLAAGLAGAVATSLTVATVWMASRLDAVAFLLTLGVERMRGLGGQAVNGFVSSAVGSTGFAIGGNAGIALAASGFLAAVAISAFGLRALAAASRRRRM
jgi:hypothetical protein